MKKLFYILMITFVSSLAFTSCTEEEVKPNQNTDVLGGNVMGDELK
ncbi:MAG TPA: hypothetical protein VGK59_13830 [Ohtaekwangia sp.]